MIKKIRPLTELELQQLRINQAALEKKLNQPISIYFSVVVISVLTVISLFFVPIKVVIIYFIILVIVFFYSHIKVNRRFKNQKKLEIENIQKVLEKGKVEIIEYKCNRAIHFALDEFFIKNCFFLELDNGKILSLYTDYWNDSRILPNTHFELYVDEQIQSVFSSKANPIGVAFKAVHFPDEIYYLIKDLLEEFKDGEIFDTSFDDFLNEIERQVKV